MSSERSRLGAALLSLSTLCTCALASRDASAQACCAGSGVVTPGRLGPADTFLEGGQIYAKRVMGNFNKDSRFATQPAGTDEYELGQDLFAAMRVLRRGQLAVLLPFLETFRRVPGMYETGGGLADINLALRWDFLDAGESKVPGIALLGGVTFPTGTPPESASKALATDATGVGAFQGNFGLALEQIWGPVLVTASGRVAKRMPKTTLGIQSELGAQWTALVSGAYVFKSGVAAAVFASYTLEGSASVNGVESAESARRSGQVGVSGMLPIAESWRLQGSVSASPPVSQLGRNEPALLGVTVGFVRTW